MPARSGADLLEGRLLRQSSGGVFEHLFARVTLECRATAAQRGDVQRGEGVAYLEATVFDGWHGKHESKRLLGYVRQGRRTRGCGYKNDISNR